MLLFQAISNSVSIIEHLKNKQEGKASEKGKKAEANTLTEERKAARNKDEKVGEGLIGLQKRAVTIKASKSSRRGTPDKKRGSVSSVTRLALARAYSLKL